MLASEGMELESAQRVAECLQQIVQVLQAIEQRLAQLAQPDETLGYPEAAKKAGISERKLSEWVNSGRLVEGWHFRRVDGSVRFPPDFARRLFAQRPPAAKKAVMEQALPKDPHPPRLRRPVEKRQPGSRSAFNPAY